MAENPRSLDCLILVDLQNDFMPGGALPVPDGDEVVEVANELATLFGYVVASQDWHPANHLSFASQHAGHRPGDIVEIDGLEQVLWPDHCVQRSPGADFHASIDRRRIDAVFRKGLDRNVDSYSAFFDNARRRSTGLAEHLHRLGIGSVALMGLATDYCVKFSALDAVSLGLRTVLIADGCRGIDLSAGDIDRACQEMRSAGVGIVRAGDFK
ncbi:MAG: bifunctional nicotinamidase/pyrazinamidase [Bryobacterales bacterium]|nr:bifunctional nicotinamidase/pyrazinamidase [Bryobacterales bacterium]